MFSVALDGYDVNRLRFVRVHVNREPKVGRQIPADFLPQVAGIIRAHDVPVFLHEQHTWAGTVHGTAANAMTDLRFGIGNVLAFQTAVDWPPRFPGIVASKRAGRRNANEHPLRIACTENYRQPTHSARAWLPSGPCP